MPGAFRDYVESVRSAVDIAQVVGEAVVLRKAGRSMVGLCPFHQERSGSFHVDPVKGLYYCFGCGAGGDAFKFVMNLHNVEFPEAVAMLGDRLGIPRPAPATPAEASEDRRRRRVLDTLTAAQEFFTQRLASADGEAARAYVARRGLTLGQAQVYGLGFAPAGWDGLLRRLSARAFQVEDLLQAGVVIPRPNREGVYDRFRNRLTFPIRDTAGRIVSFGGRSLGDEDPKYLNGPETVVYDKGRTLFRFNETMSEIRQAGRAVVVEGYFDAVSLAAAGVPGVVAVCGTAFNATHAKLVRRCTDRVVLLFDGDDAGRRAVHRALDPALAQGLSVRVASPPEGQDPDDVARCGGLAAAEACLEAAQDLPQFLVSEARRLFDVESLDGRVKCLEMVLGHLLQLESPLARAEASNRVADGLGIEDQVLRDELRRAARERRREVAPPAAALSRRPQRLSEAEAQLIRFLCDTAPRVPGEASQLVDAIPREALGAPVGLVLERWVEARRRGEFLDFRRLSEVAPAEVMADILALAFAPDLAPDAPTAWGVVAALKESRLRARLLAVQEEIEKARDPGEQELLLREKLTLAREIEGVAAAGPLGAAVDQALLGGRAQDGSTT